MRPPVCGMERLRGAPLVRAFSGFPLFERQYPNAESVGEQRRSGKAERDMSYWCRSRSSRKKRGVRPLFVEVQSLTYRLGSQLRP